MLRNLLAKGSPDPHSKTMVAVECRDVYASSGALNDFWGTFNHNRVNLHCGNWIQTSITILEGMLMKKTMQVIDLESLESRIIDVLVICGISKSTGKIYFIFFEPLSIHYDDICCGLS